MNSVKLKPSYVLGFVLAMAIVPGRAQPIVIKQGSPMPEIADKPVPLCDLDAIDSTFAFSDQPKGEQTVSLYFLNKGNTACRLKDPPNPSFAVDGHSMYVESCSFCGPDLKDPDGKPMPFWHRPENQVVLAPGATAAQVVLVPGATTAIDLNWASTGVSCQWADWTNIFFNWTEVYDFRK